MSELEDLRIQVKPLVARINEIEREQKTKEITAKLGKCYRYRNCYSCPKTDADYWWLYKRVTHINGGCLAGFSFEIDRKGKLEVDADSYVSHSLSGYEEISLTEFMQAWADFKNQILSLHPDELTQ